MVINLQVIKNIDITNNHLKKLAYEDIEYEIFKCKNILLTNNKEFKKLINKYNINDIMNYPPKPYIIKQFKLEQNSKKNILIEIKEEIPIVNYNEENKNDNNNEKMLIIIIILVMLNYHLCLLLLLILFYLRNLISK